jgi:tetraacyldisaccharide 4'-kinase
VLKGKRVFAFSGIARNKDFESMLTKQDCEMAGALSFPDHYDYSNTDLAAIFNKAGKCHVDYIVTTEKDYVRMANRASWPIPLLALRIKVSFDEDKEGFNTYLKTMLCKHKLKNNPSINDSKT